jgi:general secretion pathway protein E
MNSGSESTLGRRPLARPPSESDDGADARPAAGAATDPAAEDIARLRRMADEYGVDLLLTVPDDVLDPALVAGVPVEWARANGLLPVRMGGRVRLLTDDTGKVGLHDYLAMMVGEDMDPVLAPRAAILGAIERCYYRRDDSPKAFLKDLQDAEGGSRAAAGAGTDDLLQVAEKAPVTQLANLILLEAVKRGASDIHFEPFEDRLRVRYRIDGVLYEQASPPKHMQEALVSRLKIMARMDIAERRLPQDGMARVRVGEREIDIRASTVPVAEGERVVLRLLNLEHALLPLDVLGMAPDMMRAFAALLEQPNGMIIVSGPTGSGKTTTLYAALRQLDASRLNIMTIEDPIEYQLPDIGQIQVKPKIGLTFASGLRHIVRQDPDVVLVGEVRDIETAEIAIRASLTGHLVFSTLHTNDAPSALLRLIDMGVESYLLAACLRGVLSQRLVRRLCPQCKASATPSPALLQRVWAHGGRLVASRTVWEPRGCPGCLEGYSGRTGVFELMVVDGEIREAVRKGEAGADTLRAMAAKRGMRDLMADGLAKVAEGVTSLSEVLDVAS